jgi:hypothetical protein
VKLLSAVLALTLKKTYEELFKHKYSLDWRAANIVPINNKGKKRRHKNCLNS